MTDSSTLKSVKPVNQWESIAVSTQDDIKQTYINSTKAQRSLWVHLMQKEKRRTGDGKLNLSTWIINQLPDPETYTDDDEDNKGNR